MTDKQNDSAPGRQINWDLTLKVVAAIVSAATLGFGIYQYVVKPRRDAEASLQSKKQQLEANLYSKKQDVYNRAMASAATFASSSTQAEAEKAANQFWTLYLGELSAVESEGVKKAMQTFGGALKKWEEFNDPSDFTKPSDFEYVPDGETKPVNFNDLSYALTQACRKDLEIK